MAGPSSTGQRNKSHKGGSGPGARQKHRQGKEGPGQSQPKAGKAGVGKLQRQLASKQQRGNKKAQLLDKRRKASGSPLVVALLPLSEDVGVQQLWDMLLAACAEPPSTGSQATSTAAPSRAVSRRASFVVHDQGHESMAIDSAEWNDKSDQLGQAPQQPLVACTVGVAGRRLRLTLLPPLSSAMGPGGRHDPLAVVDLGKAAEVVLLVTTGGGEGSAVIDAAGLMALSVLSALGLPETVLAVQSAGAGRDASAPVGMKDRSASRKRAEKAVGAALAGQERRAFHVDGLQDAAQLIRHLAERPAPSLPHWRTQRPSLLVESAEWVPPPSGSLSQGQLALTGWVRCAGLSTHHLITVPGAGEFQIDLIQGPPPQVSHTTAAAAHKRSGQEAMDQEGSAPVVLAQCDPELREPLDRENVAGADGEGVEQTWPSAAELEDAAQRATMFKRRQAHKKVPEGTSDYQAAWLVEDDEQDDEDVSDDMDGEGDEAMGAQGAEQDSDSRDRADVPDDDAGTDIMALDEADSEEGQEGRSRWERLQAERAEQRMAEGEEAERPDEVDLLPGVEARVRLQKFRGLKSFRSSPWDAKEWLPLEYSRVFAFQNLQRAQKRALAEVARASSGADPSAVEPGTWARVLLCNVPADVAARVVARVAASFPSSSKSTVDASCSSLIRHAPLVAFGLMTHEAKMSVVHFGVTKALGYTEPLPNKERLLMVTGLRSFVSTPVFSADTPGDKHKMERWLRAGQPAMATCYAPISYPPLPLLAFKEGPNGGVPQLAATGALRGANPDRVILKKIVLTGFPVRVHKKRATVRYMFHHPDDVRWFRPVELSTRSGRRGRITEALGTHGAMKAVFDGPVQQREVICMSLYKRVFPKWPADLKFSV